jgi:spermidine synthase
VLVHRLISAKLLNNYAFLVISLTMLGFAAAGVVLTRFRDAVLARRDEYVAGFAAAYALSLVAAAALFSHLPAGAQIEGTAAGYLRVLLSWLPASFLFAIPFAFAGLILGALLADTRLPSRVIYGADLAGSAAGAFVVLAAVVALGVERSLVLCAAVTLAGTVALAWPRGKTARALAAAAAVAIALAGLRPGVAFPVNPRIDSLLRPDGAGHGLEYVQWDPVARIEISRIRPPRPEELPFPLLIGKDAAFHARFKRMLTQNDFAFSYMVEYDGRRESLAGIEQTIYAAAYQATSVPQPRVVAIGVGGGFDILTALHFDASSITGVEVNGATLDILRRVYADYFAPWVRDPRVRLVHDDGRHFLAATPDVYDVIQLSGVDSYSGTPGAAHVFSENHLYTAEAFDLFLTRLSPQGILNVMRLEWIPPREMLRALVTAGEALRRAGADDPSRHIATLTARGGSFTALLVKKTPFSAEEIARLRAWAAGEPFFVLSAAPDLNEAGANYYQVYLGLRDAARQRAFVRGYPFDISPATDDRPFFFNFSYWSHLWGRDAAPSPMHLTVLILTAIVGLAAVACVYLPLKILVGGPRRPPWRASVYFAAIATGYMAVEIALLQKCSVLLGHPNYALSVVLAALLLATGAGALFSTTLLAALRRLRFAAYALAVLLLAVYAAVFPLLGRWVGLPFAARAAAAAALIAPIGLLLGIFMPWGLERLKETSPALVPWAWGINGIFSVLAPVLAVAFAMSWGSAALFLSAVPLYLAAALALDADDAPAPVRSPFPEPAAAASSR